MLLVIFFFFYWVANCVRLLHWSLDWKIIIEHENNIRPFKWHIVKVICIFSIMLFSPVEKKRRLIGVDPFIIVMYSHRLGGTPCCEPSQSVVQANTAALMLLEDLHAERCLTASTPGCPDPSWPLVSLSSLSPDKTPEPHCGLFSTHHFQFHPRRNLPILLRIKQRIGGDLPAFTTRFASCFYKCQHPAALG